MVNYILPLDAPPSGDEPSSSSIASRPLFTASSARLSPISMETPMQPVHSRTYTDNTEAVRYARYKGMAEVGHAFFTLNFFLNIT